MPVAQHQVTSLHTALHWIDQLGTILAVASDIDYTLVQFDLSHAQGLNALLDHVDEALVREVDDIYQLLVQGHRLVDHEAWVQQEDFAQLVSSFARHQQIDQASPGAKHWSRELWFKIAAERLGVYLAGERIMAMRDAYWQAVRQVPTYYRDTLDFMQGLKERGICLVLMTGSDAIMRVDEDGFCNYDPAFSDRYKRAFLQHLSQYADALVIGDPVDKPHERFFEVVQGEVNRLMPRIAASEILAMGDSEKSDLLVPSRWGWHTLLIRHAQSIHY